MPPFLLQLEQYSRGSICGEWVAIWGLTIPDEAKQICGPFLDSALVPLQVPELSLEKTPVPRASVRVTVSALVTVSTGYNKFCPWTGSKGAPCPAAPQLPIPSQSWHL